MNNFAKFKYDKTIDILRVSQKQITVEDFKKLSKIYFKIDKNNTGGYVKLNRLNNAPLFSPEEEKAVHDYAESLGYYRLNAFADVYRKTTKLSYASLLTRITKYPILTQYLIDAGIIIYYQNKPAEGDIKRGYAKKMIVVNFEKRFELIQLILECFLTKSQKNQEIRND